MKPLLEIHSVPISIEFKVSRAQIKPSDPRATVELSHNNSGYRVKSRPIRLNVDSVEARRAPMPETQPYAAGRAQENNEPDDGGAANLASYSATAHMLDNGQMQVDMQLNSDAVQQLSMSIRQAASSVGFVSDYPAEDVVVPENLSLTYEIDKLSFDFSASAKNIEFEFVPASIEFSISEYPSLVIKYLGEPLYVPPSANPNYEPVDEVI